MTALRQVSMDLSRGFVFVLRNESRSDPAFHGRAGARRTPVGADVCIVECATRELNLDVALPNGLSERAIADLIRAAVKERMIARHTIAKPGKPALIAAVIGARRSAGEPVQIMCPPAAEEHHAWQINAISETDADLLNVCAMTNTPETIGIVRAARTAGLPVIVGFAVEEDGRLQTQQPLHEAVREVDCATMSAPLGYLIECSDPAMVARSLAGHACLERVRGFVLSSRHDPGENALTPRRVHVGSKALLHRLPWMNIFANPAVLTTARRTQQMRSRPKVA